MCCGQDELTDVELTSAKLQTGRNRKLGRRKFLKYAGACTVAAAVGQFALPQLVEACTEQAMPCKQPVSLAAAQQAGAVEVPFGSPVPDHLMRILPDTPLEGVAEMTGSFYKAFPGLNMTVIMKHDAKNLYMAVAVTGGAAGSVQRFFIAFDANRNGVDYDTGDDLLELPVTIAPSSDPRNDIDYAYVGKFNFVRDTTLGGANNKVGAAIVWQTPNGSPYAVAFAKIDMTSGDLVGKDITLLPGETMRLAVGVIIGDREDVDVVEIIIVPPPDYRADACKELRRRAGGDCLLGDKDRTCSITFRNPQGGFMRQDCFLQCRRLAPAGPEGYLAYWCTAPYQP